MLQGVNQLKLLHVLCTLIFILNINIISCFFARWSALKLLPVWGFDFKENLKNILHENATSINKNDGVITFKTVKTPL